MKKFLLLVLVFTYVFILPAQEEAEYVLDIDTSYSFGMFLANFMFQQFGMPYMMYDYDAFRDGFRDFNENAITRFDMEIAMDFIDMIVMEIEYNDMLIQQAEGERNRVIGAEFLSTNGLRAGVITTSSGLQIEMLREGNGEIPNISDTVTVHYRGTLIDGRVFDSSYDYGEPLTFPLDRVIPGWSEGLRMMREGGRAILYVPPELAYMDMSLGIVTPHSVLIFDVEFLEIQR